MTTNFERLRKAGVIRKVPLPEQYRDVIDGLSPTEVDALISVQARFDEAVDDVQGHGLDLPEPGEFIAQR